MSEAGPSRPPWQPQGGPEGRLVQQGAFCSPTLHLFAPTSIGFLASSHPIQALRGWSAQAAALAPAGSIHRTRVGWVICHPSCEGWPRP